MSVQTETDYGLNVFWADLGPSDRNYSKAERAKTKLEMDSLDWDLFNEIFGNRISQLLPKYGSQTKKVYVPDGVFVYDGNIVVGVHSPYGNAYRVIFVKDGDDEWSELYAGKNNLVYPPTSLVKYVEDLERKRAEPKMEVLVEAVDED